MSGATSADVVREQLSEQLDQELRVEVSPGVWLTAAGGVLLVVGGALSVAWSRRPSAHPAETP